MALDYNTIKYMNLFTPQALANEFMEQYQYEFGQKKVIEVHIFNFDADTIFIAEVICIVDPTEAIRLRISFKFAIFI